MIEIDGSYLEGGGQILRTAVSLSAIAKKPCRVFNIRQGRPRPGLSTQHLLGIQALCKLCNGKLEGDYLGSFEIKFYPNNINRDRVSVNIPTAGSITLVLQTILAPALFNSSPVQISFEGGATDTFFSPTIDHFRFVFLKIIKKMGVKTKIDIEKRGFYPEGGAKLAAEISPSQLKPLSLNKRGGLEKIIIISGATENLRKNKVAERQISGAKQVLGKLKLPLQEKIEYYPSLSTGSQINIIAQLENTVFGADNLGKLGKSAEIVGKEAAEDFLKEAGSNACLDKHAADQILPFMALAPGKSQVTVSEITNHCKTNIWVIEKFLEGKFEIEGNKISWIPK